MKRLLTITATAEIEIDEDELPEDCDSAEEALDAIKESLDKDTFLMDVGDLGEIEFTIITVSESAQAPTPAPTKAGA